MRNLGLGPMKIKKLLELQKACFFVFFPVFTVCNQTYVDIDMSCYYNNFYMLHMVNVMFEH